MAQLMRAPTICFNPKLFPKHTRNRMALNANNMTSSLNNNTNNRKLPILLFDIMDTIVRDPFYHDIPAFFRMSFKELIECKHPTAWIEFENGVINEEELAGKFFKDGRPFDLEGLKNCMRRGYSYIDGIEQLLQALKQNNYEMHAFTNYPIWYKIIEDKLNISNYLSWTFCSCIYGKRKPDPYFYLAVVEHLKVDPVSCIFIDDRIKNVEAAVGIGITGLHFKNPDLLRQDLERLGVDISIDGHVSENQLKPAEGQT
ncbi:Haloacid dehalogenase-like hydrolase superfamily protein isoform 1 [Theobroma cacao]|uniref:Haloacid dehalogenase-like hydrolase superfamily protein isoform 1 n=1 Tax=Theobroma cacao TaxID=3641 RepID=A0A061EYV3_THECC|nr:Haloacid dehalogenase-like hydrolase superfamily protein isoform 1 [Theobroma cacao]